jgi:hypothetical protein
VRATPFLSLMIVLVSSAALADPPPPPPSSEPARRPTHTLTVNVPSNVFGAYSLEYVHAITDHVAVFAEPTYFGPSVIPGFRLAIDGPGVVMGVMIHPFGEAPDGLFIAPEWYVTYIDALEDTDGYKPGLGAGAIAGWSFRFFDHLMLSVGLGGTANILGNNLGGGYGFGLLPVLRLNLGAAF